MLSRFCVSIAHFFVRRGLLQDELYDWCVYWLLKRIMTFGVVFLMLVSGGLLFGFPSAAFFLIGVLPIRRHLVGFHASSPARCALLSEGVMLGGLLAVRLLPDGVIVFACALVMVFCLVSVIFFLRRQDDSKLNLSPEEITENYRRSVFIIIFVNLLSLPFMLSESTVVLAMSCQMGLLVAVCSAMITKIAKRRNRNENTERND